MERVISYEGREPYIFISYAHRDSEQVLPLLAGLQRYGYRIWYDESIRPSTEWDKVIAEHIENCSFFLALISANYLESENCKDELSWVRDLRKPRLLVYLENVKLPGAMEMRLGRLQAMFYYDYTDQRLFYEKLSTAEGIRSCRKTGWAPEDDKVTGFGSESTRGVKRTRKAFDPKNFDPQKAVRFDRGYISAYMAPDRDDLGEKEANLDEPFLLLTDRMICMAEELRPILEQIDRAGGNLLIIASDVEGEALDLLIENSFRGRSRVVAVKAPSYGDRRKDVLQDIAIVTGGTVILEGSGIELENVTIDKLGRAEYAKVRKEETGIMDGKSAVMFIWTRIEQVRAQIRDSVSDFDRGKLEERLRMLTTALEWRSVQ